MKLNKIPSQLQSLQPTVKQIDANSWRYDKKSSTARGYGYKWQKARKTFLTANPLCLYCQREGKTTEATVVDHIIPHKGDQKLFWRTSNWQPLCASCHSRVKQREENGSITRN